MSLVRTASAVVILAVTSMSASAFYFPGWPGATRPPAMNLLQTRVDVPPTVAPPILVDPPTPQETPEPTSLVLAGVGLGAFMMRKLVSKKN